MIRNDGGEECILFFLLALIRGKGDELLVLLSLARRHACRVSMDFDKNRRD